MRRTRRKRPRVAWFPTFGGAAIPESLPDSFPGVEATLNFEPLVPLAPTEVQWDAFPLTFDETEDSETAQADPAKRTLRDIVQGNEWRLRRIVGKAFIGVSSSAIGTDTECILDVALGFIVCKTYDDGAPITDFNEVNPLSQDSMEDPWIWRRRWLLNPFGQQPSNYSAQSAISTISRPAFWGYPQNTVQYGSAVDGPHIDAKTSRVIHRQERLFGILAARRYYGDMTPTNAGFQKVELLLDYRLLGSLRGQAYGNRGNTSR